MAYDRAIQNRLLWFNAHSFIHAGIGRTGGLIDLPVARESGTNFPYIPGSGAKGAWRDMVRIIRASGLDDDPVVTEMFGQAENEGQILFQDIRLVALPLRSPTHGTTHVTSREILMRLAMDIYFADMGDVRTDIHGLPDLKKNQAVAVKRSDTDPVFVEEFKFTPPDDIAQIVLGGLTNGPLGEISDLVIVSDAMFKHFCQHNLHVRMRNKLNPVTKIVEIGALWSEESLPPGTLMTEVICNRMNAASFQTPDSPVRDLLAALEDAGGFLQVGGNETVGEGWFHITPHGSKDTGQQKGGHDG